MTIDVRKELHMPINHVLDSGVYVICDADVTDTEIVFELIGSGDMAHSRFVSVPPETPIDHIPQMIQAAVDKFERQRELRDELRKNLAQMRWTAAGGE